RRPPRSLGITRTLGAMPRPTRIQLPGGTYHVTARGNRRQALFFDDADRDRFLGIFHRAACRSAWRTLAYCLMTNHFHLVVETPDPTLSSGMHYLNGLYARRFNERHGFEGHLFERRFAAAVIGDDAHLAEVLRYVAFNPVRAGLCDHPADWPWSSFRGVGRSFAFAR